MWCSGRKRAKQNPTNVSREKEIAYSGTPVKNGRKRFWGYGEWIENRTEKRQGSEERKKRRVIRGRKKTREKLNIEIEKNVSTDVSESAQLRGNAWIKKKREAKNLSASARRRTEKRKVECKWEVLKAGIRRNARQSRISRAANTRCRFSNVISGGYFTGYIESRTAAYVRCNPYDCLIPSRRAARAEKGEGRGKWERGTRNRAARAKTKAVEHPSFPNSRVVRVRKEESFNGITERFQAEGRA